MSQSVFLCTLLLLAAAPCAFPADADAPATIEAVRQYALSYSKTLPNFLCTLTTQHVTRPPNAVNIPNIQAFVIVEQLSFFENREVRKTIKVSGDIDSTHGPLSQGEFGTLLLSIFDPAKGTTIKWSRAATLNGRKVDVLSYHVPQASGYVLTEVRGELHVPFAGQVYADRETHAVLRITAKCIDIPLTSDYRTVELTLDYAAVRVAAHEYVLPSRFVLNYVNGRQDRQNLNDGRFSDYREFSADSAVHFDAEKE